MIRVVCDVLGVEHGQGSQLGHSDTPILVISAPDGAVTEGETFDVVLRVTVRAILPSLPG